MLAVGQNQGARHLCRHLNMLLVHGERSVGDAVAGNLTSSPAYWLAASGKLLNPDGSHASQLFGCLPWIEKNQIASYDL